MNVAEVREEIRRRFPTVDFAALAATPRNVSVAQPDERIEFFRSRAIAWHEQHVRTTFRDARASLPQVISWADAFVAGRAGRHHSLMLLGPTGTGKTYQAYGTLRRVAEAGIRNPFWLGGHVSQLLADLRPNGSADFDKCANAPILLLDDIGSERTSPWTEETALRLFNHRYESALPIIVTGNGSWDDIAAYLGDRMASRLVEMCNLVEVRGQDRRWQR